MISINQIYQIAIFWYKTQFLYVTYRQETVLQPQELEAFKSYECQNRNNMDMSVACGGCGRKTQDYPVFAPCATITIVQKTVTFKSTQNLGRSISVLMPAAHPWRLLGFSNPA
jgi:hypothetical protein